MTRLTLKTHGGYLKMRITIIVAALALFLAALTCSANAQSDEFANGEVTRIDTAASKITIKHGPLKKFNMDMGMTMVYRVPDPQMLKDLKPGDKIKFMPDRANGQFTVTKIEKEK